MTREKSLTGENQRSVLATSLILAGANLLPLIAIWKLEWKLYDLLVLYWVEFIFIGCAGVFRIAGICHCGASLASHLPKIIFIPFFVVHFGFFMVGLGLLIQILFGKENFDVEDQIVSLLVKEDAKIFWPLVIAHVFSFFQNYLSQGEFRRTTVVRRMVAPYFRVIPPALLVVAGGWALARYGQTSLPGLFGLVLAKTLLDLVLHPVIHFGLMRRSEITE